MENAKRDAWNAVLVCEGKINQHRNQCPLYKFSQFCWTCRDLEKPHIKAMKVYQETKE